MEWYENLQGRVFIGEVDGVGKRSNGNNGGQTCCSGRTVPHSLSFFYATFMLSSF